MLASSETDLQHVLHGFAAACNFAGIKIKTCKSEAPLLHFSKNPEQCSSQVGGVSLKVKANREAQVSWVRI